VFKCKFNNQGIVRVRPHRKQAALAGSDLCLRWEGFQTVLCKIATSASNRKWADMTDHSRLWQAPVICVVETDLPDEQYRMAEEFNEKLTEKVWEYMFLYDTGHLEYKNLVKIASH
jgi:hypothetical protein